MKKQSDNTNPKIQKTKYISPTSYEDKDYIYEYVDGRIISRKKSNESEITITHLNIKHINGNNFKRHVETNEVQQRIEEVAKRPRQNKK